MSGKRKLTRAQRRVSVTVEALKDLVNHCYLYSGYECCGYAKMSRSQRDLFNFVCDRPGQCEECGQPIYYAEDEKPFGEAGRKALRGEECPLPSPPSSGKAGAPNEEVKRG